ncbi:MAG: YbjN domain-containing protein [Pseudolabrys sp.]|nr:YbjN domain-containing protein [Pseudolabrys sp.]MBV9954926.1 YbjN domain-containing protein [Pseudolabrys sp.]
MALPNLSDADAARLNPLDVVERIASGKDWSFERNNDDEITILVSGKWTDYQVSYTWMGDIEALHLACAFDLRVPDRRRSEVQQLISLVNEQLWVGHFDLWTGEGMVMFRHALMLNGGIEVSGRQCEALLTNGLEACERYFSAFQFVVWAGKQAREALDAAMFETSGEA